MVSKIRKRTGTNRTMCLYLHRRYFDHTLEFIELSLDSNLACNALRVLISRECGPLVGGVDIVELASHVVILFATATSVHRLVLPHPEAIVKVCRLLSANLCVLCFLRTQGLL